MTTPTPLPQVPGSPQAPAPVMPGQMAAQQPAPPGPPQLDDPQERSRQFLNNVQQIHQMVEDTAMQHPEAAAGARRVQAAIESWIMDVVTSPTSSGSGPVSPRIVG